MGEARDKLLLEVFMQRWLKRVASRRAQEDDLIKQLQKHSVSRFFRRWHSKLKQKRQEAWRNDMRQKMKIIKSKSDTRIKQDAWDKWRQLQRSHHAESHYQLTLLSRCLFRWKTRIEQLDDLDVVADNFSRNIQLTSLKNFWDLWKHVTRLRHNENIMTRRVDYRVISTTFNLWRTRKSVSSWRSASQNWSRPTVHKSELPYTIINDCPWSTRSWNGSKPEIRLECVASYLTFTAFYLQP